MPSVRVSHRTFNLSICLFWKILLLVFIDKKNEWLRVKGKDLSYLVLRLIVFYSERVVLDSILSKYDFELYLMKLSYSLTH